MEVTLSPAPPGEVGSDAIAIEVAGVTIGTPPVATVLLTNHNAEPVVQARLSIVAYTAQGTVVGGGTGMVPTLTPHMDTQLVVPLPGTPPSAQVEGFIAFTAFTSALFASPSDVRSP
jgi:hypothetical protein